MTSHLLYQEEAYSGHVLQYDPSFLLTGGVASFFLSIFLFKVSNADIKLFKVRLKTNFL